jgi:molybdopterin synthase catalytic subunit
MMVHLSRQPIDVSDLSRQVEAASRGAVVTFVGLVRDHHAGRGVVRLEYSAYELMAEAECARIVAEAEARWAVAVALSHRLGELAIGETAVAVAVAAAHRGDAFDACRHVIEAVKCQVPIWKREYYADGSVAWVDPTTAGGVQPTGVQPATSP